jgi:hypothetical protein
MAPQDDALRRYRDRLHVLTNENILPHEFRIQKRRGEKDALMKPNYVWGRSHPRENGIGLPTAKKSGYCARES